ncbi:MAG: class II aldolase/adducin family protein, partial [Gammaproteobacteria bacterium]|nr:class II aldolase/adducin family protein [Gammaproteobacteria bacterium]
MAETEGVVQFNCCLAAPGAKLSDDWAEPLLAWRTVLRRLELIGQTEARYVGLGYGNISRRVPGAAGGFLITASQTSGIADAGVEHLVWVRRWDLGRFQVEAEGALPPSSESLTHAML